MMKAAEIRTRFLKYFEKNGHTIVESSALVPHNDPTLLFTNAGMVQFKDVFLGKDKRPYSRATTSQKCVRAGGKHNDLENVGFTARHHTFFEMLGNFSFGDYFKKEAIRFAWEFVTKELKLPKDKLYVTVFEKDDEAAEIWNKQEGVPHDRIFRFGEKDNFWAMGDTGPCGPCSEIFIDRGEKYGCKKPTCAMGCDCDRFMEFWNLVFMQYERDASGKLTPLPKPSVDTGAGLERIASILQEVNTNYDTDLFLEIIEKTAALAKNIYRPNAEEAVSFRVIADHARATTFLIGDGVFPSNEGRGYVLRRIIRRAIRHGKKVGFTEPFLYKVCPFVIDQMKLAYPDLLDKRSLIEKAVFAEEEQFFRTLEKGLSLLEEETAKLKAGNALSGDVAFKLYDTFGFPLDLTKVILVEKGLTLNEVEFETSMDKQRSESRKNWKGSGEEAVSGIYLQLANELSAAGHTPQFFGYEKMHLESKCLVLLDENRTRQNTLTGSASSKNLIEAVFAVTPFYPEGGGQVGDQGRVFGNGFEGKVVDVKKPGGSALIVVQIQPLKGTIEVGKTYTQEVADETRAATQRNHTATHLLHWALREVLGKHVKQAGSLVEPGLLRFDFTHFQALTNDEIVTIENKINEKIWRNEAVSKKEMPKEEAIAAGAIAFFGEKYGDLVRVVRVGDYSTELCGGTHVERSGDIFLLKIASESGIAAGVRRIIAYTGPAAFQYLRERDMEVKQIQERIRASSPSEIQPKIDKLLSTEKDLRREIEQFHAQSAQQEVNDLLTQVIEKDGRPFLAGLCRPAADGPKRVREIADQLKQKNPELTFILGVEETSTGKAYLLAASGPKAKPGFHAGDLIKRVAPMIGGKGGGKPDLAQAGGTLPSGLPAALKGK